MRKKEDIKYTLDQVNTMELNTDWDIFVYMYLTGLYSNSYILKVLGKSTGAINDKKGKWYSCYQKLRADIPYNISVRKGYYCFDSIENFIYSNTCIGELTSHEDVRKHLNIHYDSYKIVQKLLEEKYGEYTTYDYSEDEIDEFEELYLYDIEEEIENYTENDTENIEKEIE